ncbi:hypothetical protein [Acidiplasma sp.]|uniref:hypothetical protein n=1 Tax=Acidiplasma sp. TaxID=1872114 RepID=UPI002584F4F6|nr:hypothetical protein [Acidiplasma sp.]
MENKNTDFDLKSEIYNFLTKNRNMEYTADEILKSMNISLDDYFTLHIDLARLIWEGKIKYRDIIDQNGKIKRFYSIDEGPRK